MLKRALRVAIAVVVAATDSSWACAQTEIKTHIIDEQTVEKLATSLNHTSMVEFPEPVTAAVVGTEVVRMEFRDNVVILEPQKAGVQTNLMVWMGGLELVYEVMPASDTSQWPSVIHEAYTPPPPPPPGPTPAEAMALRDSTHGSFLLNMHGVTVCRDLPKEKGVHIWIEQVAADHDSFYVRLSAVNRTKILYRIATPVVYHIIPMLSAKLGPRLIDTQLTDRQVAELKRYDTESVTSHGSTLESHDLKPGESVSWVMAVAKVGHPAEMYKFSLPPVGKQPVQAVVIF
jgi:hypothetical protein